MSEKHKQILIAGNAAIAAGNNEGFLAFCTDDTEWNFIGDKILKGKAAVRQWMNEEYIRPPKVSVENLIAEGNFLIAQGELAIEDAAGTERRYSYCDVWRFEDDKIVALKAFVVEMSDAASGAV